MMKITAHPIWRKGGKYPCYVVGFPENEADLHSIYLSTKPMAIITKIGINRWKLEISRKEDGKIPTFLCAFENLGVYPDYERALLKFKAEALF